jgi:acetyl esterase/lipase
MATCAATHAIPTEWESRLDPEWVSLWNDHGRHQLRADEVSVPEYRKDPKAYSFTYAAWEGPKVFQEEEFDVPVTRPSGTVRIRVYTPEGPGPFPVHVNFHGGGWVLGGLQSEAGWCRSICNNVGIKVIDVDYRMAPEYPFPTAIYDSWEVVQWVRQLGIMQRVGIADTENAGSSMCLKTEHQGRQCLDWRPFSWWPHVGCHVTHSKRGRR